MKSLSMKALFRIFLVFAFMTALNLLPFVVKGTLPGTPTCDTQLQFIPFYSFGSRQLAQGHFPQIVPIFSGHDIASFGQGYIYPTFFLGILLGIPVVPFFLLDLWLHWILAGVAMTVYCLRIRLRFVPALFAGCVYIFSSPVLWRFHGHWTFIHQIAFYPLVLLITEELIHPAWIKSKARMIGFGGLVLGFLLLAQNIQILYYLCFTQTVYLFFRFVFMKKRRGWGIAFFMGTCIFLLGILLASAYFLPIFMSYKHSFRDLIKGAFFANSFSLEFSHLYSLLFPGFFFGEMGYWGKWYASESLLSVGSSVIFFAYIGIIGIIWRRSRRRLILPSLFFIVALIMGFGNEVPWFDFLVKRIPLYASFRAHGRVGFLIAMALAILGAEGISILIRLHRYKRHRRCFWLFIALGALLLILFSFYVINRYDSPSKLALWIERSRFPVSQSGSDYSDIIPPIMRSIKNSVIPVIILSGLILSFSIMGMIKPGLNRTLAVLLSAVLFTGFFLDYNVHRKLIMGLGSLPLKKLIPEAINEKLSDISRLPNDPGRLCIVSPHSFQIINLLYPKLEAVSGLDGNLSRDYGIHLNKIQGLPVDSYQLGTQFISLNKAILDDLAVRWILIDKSLLPVTKLKTGEWQMAAEGGDFVLVEYLGWKGKVSLQGETQARAEIIENAPDRVLIDVSGPGKKDIILKNVNSPYWRAFFQDKPATWNKQGPWMNIEVSGQGRLEFRFHNKWLWVGIWMSIFAMMIIIILLWHPWKLKNDSIGR